MRIIRPNAAIGAVAENKAKGFIKKTRNRERDVESAREYLDSSHRFALMVGKVAQGEEKVMTGREAKALNEAMKARFVSVIMDNPDADIRLKHWGFKEEEP